MEEIVLQPCEWIIMEKLWANNPKTMMELYNELKVEKGWSKSTVNTLLGRMIKKNIINYMVVEKTRHYIPLVERDTVAINETSHLLERIYHGSVGMMLNTLIRHNTLDMEDIKELHELLDRAVDKK